MGQIYRRLSAASATKRQSILAFDSLAIPFRQHSAELKAKGLVACEELSASISAVTLARKLGTNLVPDGHEGRWLKLGGIAAPSAPFVAQAVAPRLRPCAEPGDHAARAHWRSC